MIKLYNRIESRWMVSKELYSGYIIWLSRDEWWYICVFNLLPSHYFDVSRVFYDQRNWKVKELHESLGQIIRLTIL